jgi:hypothetical protein
LNTRKIIFESREYIVIATLDSSEGGRYVEPGTIFFITEDINQLDRTTTHEEDYINPTTNGMLSWRSITYCSLDSDMGM